MASSPFVAAAAAAVAVLFLLATTTTTTASSSSSSSPPPKDMCSRTSLSFMDRLHRRCPPPPPRSLPLQMDGETFERILSSTSKNVRIAVLFYDPDSPLSATARIDFDMLSFMFPHVSHIAIEKSSAMPSLFSRYNIHSLPALFIVHQTGQRRYYGHKDLHSMMQFYKRTLGHDPVEYHAYDKSSDRFDGQTELQPWYLLTWREMLEKEPFLVLATMFLVMRASLYLYSQIWSQVVGVWNWCKQQFNFGMFEESRQLLGQVVNLVDVKRVWCKLKLCKTREFENGARSARIWASSLASVSLGETCCGRPSSSLEL